MIVSINSNIRCIYVLPKS